MRFCLPLLQNLVFCLSIKFGILSFCKIWYFVFPLASAIWYLRSVSAIILVFAFSFCKFVLCFGVIVQFREDICLVSAISVQFLQFGILFSAAFALWFSVIIDYGYWKRWFASVYECEVGWEELFVLELCNEKFS